MPRILQIAVGVAIVMLAAGLCRAAAAGHAGFFPGLVFLGLCVLGFGRLIRGRSSSSRPASQPAPESALAERIERLEKRMTDMQDIILSIDERLPARGPSTSARF